jgi:hypothetical protein
MTRCDISNLIFQEELPKGGHLFIGYSHEVLHVAKLDRFLGQNEQVLLKAAGLAPGKGLGEAAHCKETIFKGKMGEIIVGADAKDGDFPLA